jgi:NADH-quinone oxidoreductase subunit J
MYTQILFFILSFIALASSAMVLLSKKPIHSVLYLTLSFFSIAGHYILLNAQFLAVVHIIVYAGAIMVLFLFTVMLLNLNAQTEPKTHFLIKLAAILASGILLITLTGAVRGMELNMMADPSTSQVGLVRNLGKVLFTEYLLPFELSSFLFLSAMVGVVSVSYTHLTLPTN